VNEEHDPIRVRFEPRMDDTGPAPQERDAVIRARIAAATAVLWGYEHREHVLGLAASDREAAVQAIAEGAGVGDDAARNVADPDSGLDEWTDGDAETARRSIGECEQWLLDGEELHPAVRRAVAPISADLERTGGRQIQVEPQPVPPDANLMILADGQAVWIDPWDDDERNICEVADVLQAAIIEGTHQVWPECPHHPNNHPLAPSLAGWCCPRTRVHVADFGHLGEDSGSTQT
jgi:hypothetical protein